MTYFKRYFVHRLRTTAFRGIVLAVMGAILTLCVMNTSIRMLGNEKYLSSLSFMTVWAFFSIIAIPMFETNEFKKTRNLDLLFALPITKSQMALVHYLTGIIQILFLNSISTAAITLALLTNGFGVNSFRVISAFLGMVPIMICFYSVVIFINWQGNTFGDGLAFTAGVPIVLMLTLYIVDCCFEKYSELGNFMKVSFGKLYTLCNFTDILQAPVLRFAGSLLKKDTVGICALDFFDVVTYLFWAVLGIASAVGFVYCVKNYRAEKAGGISDSPFGYKVLIPLAAIDVVLWMWLSGISVFARNADIFILLVAMVIAYFVYRRSFKIKPADIAVVIYVGIIWALLIGIPELI